MVKLGLGLGRARLWPATVARAYLFDVTFSERCFRVTLAVHLCISMRSLRLLGTTSARKIKMCIHRAVTNGLPTGAAVQTASANWWRCAYGNMVTWHALRACAQLTHLTQRAGRPSSTYTCAVLVCAWAKGQPASGRKTLHVVASCFPHHVQKYGAGIPGVVPQSTHQEKDLAIAQRGLRP